MKHWMRLCILLLAFLMLTAPVAMAYEVPTDFEGKTLAEKLSIFLRGYNRKLKENHLYMTYREFVEAGVLTMPEKAKMLFQLRDNEIDYIQKHSVWNTRFE